MRQIDADLRDFVRNFNKLMAPHKRREHKYDSMFDFLEKEGRVYDATPYTPEEEEVILRAFENIGRTPQIKQCYYNSQSLALADELGYAEGYIATGRLPVPLEHSWNTLPSGKAVDITIRPMGEANTCKPKKLLERAKRNQAENAYMGVEFPSDLIRRTWLRTEQARMLLGENEVLEQIFERGYPKSWRSPSLGVRRGMENEWLNEPEGPEKGFKDPTRSPFEGDIPPWGQEDYEGYFPLEGKVFYLVGYVGDEPHKQKQTEKTITRKGAPIRDVGSFPIGRPFGSDYMFHPVAAIPVRREAEGESAPVVAYLADLIKSTGLFGKILRMDSFPDADVVELMGNRWFPVAKEPREWPGVKFANAYSANRLYGGPEEGGWWYDSGRPVASIPFPEGDDEVRDRWMDYLQKHVGWTSEHGTGSVLGHDVFEQRVEEQFAEPFPEARPRYE